MFCCKLLFAKEKGPAHRVCDSARRVPEMASFPSLVGHKMLCPDVHKIMPVRVDCQGFGGNLSIPFYSFISISYKLSVSKYFKNMEKKMTLS